MMRDYRSSKRRQQPGVAGIADAVTKDKGGDQAMQLAGVIQEKMRTKKRRVSDKNPAEGADFKDQKAESVVFDMTLHVPCHVAGRTASGSRWKGKTKTVSMSSFGAHLLVPESVDLEGEISILFHIPAVLNVLFSKDAFRVKAEVRPSDLDGHWPAPSGQKIVDVVFSHPLRFLAWTA